MIPDEYWIVEFYPSTGEFHTYGPKATMAELNELFADLAFHPVNAIINDGDMKMADVQIGKITVPAGVDPVKAAKRQGMGGAL